MDAQVLLAHASGQPRSWVLAHPEAALLPDQQIWLQQALEHLEAGTPLPYVLGRWEFYGLTFEVTPAVLIPRPETELLVEQAIQWVNRHPSQLAKKIQVVDVGTGSGCIAVSLAIHLPSIQLAATDLSRQALRVAARNAVANRVSQRIHLVETDLLSSFNKGCFNLICANLPYVPSSYVEQLAIFGKEPTLALDGGEDGLVLIRRLLQQARSCLAPGGLILAEIEISLGQAVLELAKQVCPSARSHVLPDYTGRDRLLKIELPVV